MKRFLSAFLFVALCVASLPLFPSATKAGVPSATVQYLQNQSRADAWNVMALRSAGQYVSADAISIDGLSTATDVERTILGVIAGGANPYQFKGVDLLAALDSYRFGAQIGDWELLNDDIFGILAYWSAGYAPGDNRIAESRRHLINNQNTDGGWGYRRGAASDSNITAMAVVALLRTGSLPVDAPVQTALLYLKRLQLADGGFPSSTGYGSDAASTAWIIYAMRAAGIDIFLWNNQGVNAFDYLNTLVNSDGSYRWQVATGSGSPIMTAYVAIALSGGPFPVATYRARVGSPTFGTTPQPPVPSPAPVAPPAPSPAAPKAPAAPLKQAPVTIMPPAPSAEIPGVQFRIEGATKQVCQGWAQAWTALDVIKEAAKQCPFTYRIESTSYGPYLAQVNDDRADGAKGWLYRVNWKQPTVGAQDFNLRLQDYVTWYFGEHDWSNLKVRIVNVQPIPTGARVYVLAEQDAGGYFAPLPNVSITVNTFWYQTDANGLAVFTMPPGWFSVQGEHNDTIRSHMSWYEVK